MGAFEEAKEWLVEKMGMWWPDADEGKLREAARHWRDFAEVAGDVTQATNTRSGTLIRTNSGEAIDTFEVFWNRYYRAGNGWLADLERTARSVANLLDKYADEVDQAKKDIDNQLAIDATVIAASIALAIPTGGASAGGGAAAATAMVRFAAARGIALSAATAEILAATVTTAAYAGLEGVALNLAVAQPLQISAGLRDGLSLADAGRAGLWSSGFGAGFGAAGSGVRALNKSGSSSPILDTYINDVGNVRWGQGGGGTTRLGSPYKTPVTRDLPTLVNPQKGGTNCRGCVVSVDKTMGGTPASSPGNLPRGSLQSIESHFPGRRFRNTSFSSLVKNVEDAGDGARGIVFGSDKYGGHVFNVINRDGDVVFIDGQTGHASHAQSWDSYQFMRTK